MREILFRGKRKDNGEWVEGDSLVHSMYKKGDVCIGVIEGLAIHSVIPETIGQYTGLTDKNGTKIFEGDIIKTRHTGLKSEKVFFFVIKYGEYIPKEYCRAEYSQWKTIGFYASDGERDYQLSNCKDLLEVIGNIHDNPELLKDGASDE